MQRRSLLKALGGLFAALPVFPAIGNAKPATPVLNMDLAGGFVIINSNSGEIITSEIDERWSDEEIEQIVSRAASSRNSLPQQR